MDKTVSLHPGGTTSACAENTRKNTAVFTRPRNYLRVRGEYSMATTYVDKNVELPPRARRILRRKQWRLIYRGTTSACAENTRRGPRHGRFRRNYLRVRGEYAQFSTSSSESMELPPRARRIHDTEAGKSHNRGTTSACAENTTQPSTNGSNIWNYLRVRGEYLNAEDATLETLELPPRARRILAGEAQRRTNQGTTSACAENTPQHAVLPHAS